MTVGNWVLSPQWVFPLRITLDAIAKVGFLTAGISGALLFYWWRPKINRTSGFFLALNIFALSLLLVAADPFLLLLAWSGISVTNLAIAPRETQTDGTALPAVRWLPPAFSLSSLFLAWVVYQRLFPFADWSETARLSQVPGLSPARLGVLWTLVLVSASLGFTHYPLASRRTEPGVLALWSGCICLPLASLTLLCRFGFLVPLTATVSTNLALFFELALAAFGLRAIVSGSFSETIRWLMPATGFLFAALACLVSPAVLLLTGVVCTVVFASLPLCLSYDLHSKGTGAAASLLLALCPLWTISLDATATLDKSHILFSALTLVSFSIFVLGCSRLLVGFLRLDADRTHISLTRREILRWGLLVIGLLVFLFCATPGLASFRARWEGLVGPRVTLGTWVLLILWTLPFAGFFAALGLSSSTWQRAELELQAAPPRIGKAFFERWFSRKIREWDEKFWKGIWIVPSQMAKSGGTFFAFWQNGTAQYALIVLLIGTLFLFWAALQSRVVW